MIYLKNLLLKVQMPAKLTISFILNIILVTKYARINIYVDLFLSKKQK